MSFIDIRDISKSYGEATVIKHLDIDYNRTSFPDGSGRPMPMLPFGDPIAELV